MTRGPMLLSVLLACSPCLAPVVSPGELTPEERGIAAIVAEREEAAIDLLARTVDVPSATENHAGVRKVGDLFAVELRAMGFQTRWVELPAGVRCAGHLFAERRGTVGKRLLLIGHLDTVLEGEGFRRDADRGYGSGASDMKGGDVVLVEALRALHGAGVLEDRQVIVALMGDEEDTGEPYAVSRGALVEAARRCDAALGFEGAVPGVAVVGRRGISSWHLETRGDTGHSSGLFAERGSGAIFEAARILAGFHEQLREPYLTFNPSVILGGTDVEYDEAAYRGQAWGKTNVVPARVVVDGDLRFLSRQQLETTRERMRLIVGRHLPQTSAEIVFADGFPSMAPSDENRELLASLDAVSRDLGLGPIAAHDPAKRGAADIAFVAEIVPGLDGLGAIGGNEHAPGEYVELDALPMLTRRAALLIYRLTR